MKLERICLYRMTHLKNVPHILQYGVTHKSSPNCNKNFVPIGDKSLIDFRNTKVVDFKGGSFVLGDFIPFYFGVRMPMLYVVQHGYNYTTPVKPEDIVYVAVSLDKIIKDPDIEYLFTDGHATDILSSFYGKEDISLLPVKIDWNAVTSSFWSGEGVDTDIKRRKQAEFLVRGDVPYKYIVGFVCYNEKAKDCLISYGIDGTNIKIVPTAYY